MSYITSPQPRPSKPARKFGHPIDELLDAAFRELQHDTGEQDPEWHHSREILGDKFKKILRTKSKP